MSRKLRFRGHALHPALTDFPIAFLPLGFLWQLVALWQGGDFWWKAAFWTILAGLAAALLAAATGFLDYLTLEDRKGPAFRTATNHMLVMLTGVSCFLGSLLAQGGADAVSGTRAAASIGFAAFGALLLMLGGWLGGELVFRHGVAVHEAEAVPSQPASSPSPIPTTSATPAPGSAPSPQRSAAERVGEG